MAKRKSETFFPIKMNQNFHNVGFISWSLPPGTWDWALMSDGQWSESIWTPEAWRTSWTGREYEEFIEINGDWGVGDLWWWWFMGMNGGDSWWVLWGVLWGLTFLCWFWWKIWVMVKTHGVWSWSSKSANVYQGYTNQFENESMSVPEWCVDILQLLPMGDEHLMRA